MVGVSFPGLPGFPHFGHNQWVSWGVTHTGADYQGRLFVERFDSDNPAYYEFRGLEAAGRELPGDYQGERETPPRTFLLR